MSHMQPTIDELNSNKAYIT